MLSRKTGVFSFVTCSRLAPLGSKLIAGALLLLGGLGAVIPANAICTNFTVSDNSLSFGTVVPGQKVSMNVTITPNDLADFTMNIQNQDPAPAFTVQPTFQRVDHAFSVSVSFQPNSSNSQGWSAELRIQGCGLSEIVDLGGGNFGGSPTVDVTDLAFGTVAIGKSGTQQITVGASTDMAAPLRITVSSSSPVVSVNPKTFQVDQNTSRQVSVTYSPIGGVALGNESVLVKAVFASTNFPVPNDLTVDLTGRGFGITTFRLPDGAVGAPYNAPLEAMGGSKPYAWTIATGMLPVGLTLDAGAGVISGTPTAAATSEFDLTATEAQSVSHTRKLDITVRGEAPKPTLDDGGFVDATGSPQSPTIGALGSIFGTFNVETTNATQVPLPTILGGVRLLLGPAAAALSAGNNANGDMIPAPLLFVSNRQINFQVPWELASSAPGQLQAVVEVAGAASDPLTVPIARNRPSLFAFDFVRPAKGVVLNLDNTAAQPVGSITGYPSRPAQPGGVIIIYANGLGPVNPPASSGRADVEGEAPGTLHHAIDPPIVRVGGVAATVSFAGLSPNFVGLYQVNATLGANTPVGNAVPITIESAGQQSPGDITIAVGAAALGLDRQ